MEKKSTGEILVALRKRKHWSQPQIATAAGVSLSTIVHIERGVQKPSLRTLEKIARALGVGVARLV